MGHGLKIQAAREGVDRWAQLCQLRIRLGILARAHEQNGVEVESDDTPRLLFKHQLDIRAGLHVLAHVHKQIGALELRSERVRIECNGLVHQGQRPNPIAPRRHKLRLERHRVPTGRIQRQRLICPAHR